MLSILIPIYNFDIRDFVRVLAKQASQLDVKTEIICLDDASDKSFHELNAVIGEIEGVVYERSELNLGRSVVRNELVKKAQFENLLFLDCDGLCVLDDYLKRYMKCLPDYDVVYGGRVYNEEAPDDHDLYFHWYCGSNREAVLVERRLENPFKSFMTNNFMIKRPVYDAIKMDEGLEGYGHEDTLFAIELKKAGFHIDHIDNPIEHIGLERFSVFMSKSENGVRNLAYLMKEDRVGASIRLVRFYKRLRKFGLIGLVSSLIKLGEGRLLSRLQGPAPNLLWFDCWKLHKLHRALTK